MYELLLNNFKPNNKPKFIQVRQYTPETTGMPFEFKTLIQRRGEDANGYMSIWAHSDESSILHKIYRGSDLVHPVRLGDLRQEDIETMLYQILRRQVARVGKREIQNKCLQC